MATTTNYSWTTPDDTALVKDGAAAIRSLGTAIDTTVFNNASAAIAKTIVDAKGDIIAATAADTVARLAVGTDGQVLKANSATATGLEWATDASGMTNPMTTTGDTIYSSSGSTPARLAIGSTGNVLTVAGGVPTWAAPSGGGSDYTLISTTRMLSLGSAVTFSSLGSYNSIYVTIETLATTGTDTTLYLKCNSSSTGTDYTQSYIRFTNSSTYSTSFINAGANYGGNSNGNPIAYYGTSNSPTVSGYFKIEGAKSANPKLIPFAMGVGSNSNSPQTYIGTNNFNGGAISSFTLSMSAGVVNDGYVRIYGSVI